MTNLQKVIPEMLDKAGVTYTAYFVPAETLEDEWRSKSINHSVVLNNGGTPFYTSYTQGIAHWDNYKKLNPKLATSDSAISSVINKGINYAVRDGRPMYSNNKLPKPSIVDVMHSLILDADCAYGSFQDFCDDLGYDSDSISARDTYEACQKTDSALKRFFTNEQLDTMRELFQDY